VAASDAVSAAGQRIPRPIDARPGQPAPWHDVPVASRTSLGIDRVRDALARECRSLDAPAPPPLHELTGLDATTAASLREAAVLVAGFEEDGDTRIVLTRRSATLRRHRGEVSFPGGRLDPGEVPLDAALREAHEEVGLDPTEVEPIAWLRPIVTFASGSIIRPFVGLLTERPTLRAQPVEVDRIFDVSLTELLADGAFREEQWRRPSPRAATPDGYVPIYFFEVAGETVWGATARILTELCCLVVGVPQR
jgi:8-oxo-dGTP pyrophosphatase MutT (NUDIX family)